MKTNRKGEWFKTCNKCRINKQNYRVEHQQEISTKIKQWRNNNKDKVQQYNKTYTDKHNPLVECSHCKEIVRNAILENHQQGYQCNVFDLESKPDYHEWLFENQTTFYDQDYIDKIKTSQYNIISWKNKKYGTSSAAPDEKLKEVLNNSNANVDYIWNWNEGPKTKTYIIYL